MGGLMFLARKLSRNRLPKWLISASAGAAMIGYLAYYDYSWFEFKSGQLPDEARIVATYQTKSFFRPWSYVSPSTNAFTVFDGRSQRVEQDGQMLVGYFLYTFHKDPLERLETHSYLINCDRMERATIDKTQSEKAPKIHKINPSDPIYQELCL